MRKHSLNCQQKKISLIFTHRSGIYKLVNIPYYSNKTENQKLDYDFKKKKSSISFSKYEKLEDDFFSRNKSIILYFHTLLSFSSKYFWYSMVQVNAPISYYTPPAFYICAHSSLTFSFKP